MVRVLPAEFFDRDVVDVARDLIGCRLRRGAVELRITETEAYRWPGDTACHARFGPTPRTRVLWGPPGTAYVYLCYGLHHLLNIVAEPEGCAAAVLIRACEPLAGLATILRRRGHASSRTQPCRRPPPKLLSGPGKVGQALALDTSWSGRLIVQGSGLKVLGAEAPSAVLVGPRVGIGYAQLEHRTLPWRFAAADSPSVTERSTLHPLHRR